MSRGGSTEQRRSDFQARIENYLELLAQGECHEETIRLRLGGISARTLERIKAEAREQDALNGEAA